jgi:bacillithiol biosynthesis cysteine-adding enzyme BshC
LKRLSEDNVLLETFHTCPPEKVQNQLGHIQKAYRQDREQVVSHLLAFHKRLGAAQPTLDNIARLRAAKTCVAIGGQQAGLLTGPTYTIHKAMSLLKLAQELSEQTPYSFVPIFWTASEDHDLAEVDHIAIFHPDGSTVQRLTYPFTDSYHGWPVGHIPLGNAWKDFLQECKATLPVTGFTDGLFKLLTDTALEAESIADWFNRLMIKLLSPYGLIIVDALDPFLKQLAAPIFAQAIAEPLLVSHLVNEAGKHLEEQGLKRQIHKTAGSCPFFLLEAEKREPVSFVRGQYRTATRAYTKTDLLAILRNEPERFSANATLRPVVADFLFPNGAFAGGPGEISYFAQLPMVYKHFQVPMPIIFPRFGCTYVLPKVAKVLAKYHLHPLDLQEDQRVLTQLMRKRHAVTKEAYWQKMRKTVQQPLYKLREQIPDIDPTLVHTVDGTLGTILHRLDTLEKKLLRNVWDKDEILTRQITQAKGALFPGNGLQERLINIFYYLNIFGLSLLDELITHCASGHTQHCFVKLW